MRLIQTDSISQLRYCLTHFRAKYHAGYKLSHCADYKLPTDMMLPNGKPDYPKMILSSRVYEVQPETPLEYAPIISARYNVPIYLKREDKTHVFSFKIRGAYNLMANLTDDEKSKGVIACSAGNHAQGVAYAAKKLNLKAVIVMPLSTPSIKVDNVKRLGANVVLFGQDFDECKAHAEELEIKHNYTNIPPFDHPLVIAGQGTIAMEIARQIPDVRTLDAIFCTVGGGGLISGVAAYIKRFFPYIKIIGCETFDADAMYKSLQIGQRCDLDHVGRFADGSSVRSVGLEPFRLSLQHVNEIIRVSTDDLCAAIKDIFEETRSIVEPSAALSLACIKKYVEQSPDPSSLKKMSLCAVISGANMNFDRLRFVAERADLGLKRECFLAVEIPDEIGTFYTLNTLICPRNITEFSYRSSGVPNDIARIVLSFQTKEPKEAEYVIEQINSIAGFHANDISNDEFAKTHLRYLTGGKSNVPDEKLIQFEFPESPGALEKFLKLLKSNCNITLFHYRNYGSETAKVLVGMQVPFERKDLFDQFLNQLNYPYKDITENPTYQQFLISKVPLR